MYEAHFGLKSRPFGTKAENTGVFVGPQQAKTISGLNKGLGAVDAVVTVTGTAGVGKTTLVERALEQISPGRTAARIGRMQLSPHEALELLFGGFGIRQQAQGTIRRFAAFRQLLAVQAAADAQVAIVIEDAERIGVDTLAELEAITAADTGDGTGANIILMGQPALNKMLQQPELARLNQRARFRAKIEPLSAPETLGYLKHAIRHAGGDFEQIFDSAVAEIVFGCSQGVPRMVNTLCETAMTHAMEDGVSRVSASLMHQVAVDAFGYEGPLPQNSAPMPAGSDAEANSTPIAADEADIGWEASEPPAKNADAPVDAVASPAAATSAPIAERTIEEIARASEADLPPAARNIVVESGRYPELPEAPEDSPLNDKQAAKPESTPTPTPASEQVANTPDIASTVDTTPPTDETGSVKMAEDGTQDEPEIAVPELINDTQPELAQLSVANVPAIEEEVAIDPDAGSTAIQEKPEGLDAIAAAAGIGTEDESQEAEDGFDLDAALTIDAGDTNVMQGITPDLDKIAAAAEAPVPPPAAPALDDLPTLSDSMRVDVDNEVKKAKATMAADDSAKPNATQSAAAAPAGTDVPSAAIPAPEPAPEPTPEPTHEMVLEPDPEFEALAAGGPTSAETQAPPAAAPTSAPTPAPKKASPPAPPAPDKPAPVAQVSEMTARIALIDPAKRTGEVDALEAALDEAKKGELDRLLEATTNPELNGNVPAGNIEQAEELPEITLDEALADQVQQNEELDKFAAEIAKANSLEEFSDKMAETLFGNEEFDAIAANVVANPPTADEGTPADADIEADKSDSADDIKLELEEPTPRPEPPPISVDGDLKQSQAVRMDMLNTLKADPSLEPAEEVELSSGPDVPAPMPKGPKPESIEDQIKTSMTQNLEALDVSKMADRFAEEEAPAPKKSGGLFSRFRKSS